ncbi:hypothetical protein JYT61_00085 [bacterium AH-315-E10]|nr:hypothetical protein [bacterium AH-315-E10]
MNKQANNAWNCFTTVSFKGLVSGGLWVIVNVNNQSNSGFQMHIDDYQLSQGDQIRIAPELGCNLFSWTSQGHDLLYFPDGFPEHAERMFDGGNPLLFPSVGRTWNRECDRPVPDEYSIYGHDKSYTMPLHGFLYMGHWNKEEEDISENEVSVSYMFTPDDGVVENHYPFDVSFQVTYTMCAGSINTKVCITNNGSESAPVAYGLHPYFRIMTMDEVELTIPCRHYLMLDPELLVPTGKSLKAESSLLISHEQEYDIVYSDLYAPRTTIRYPIGNYSVHVDFQEGFENIVVYCGVDSDFVCVEPWTRGIGGYEFLKKKKWQKKGPLNILEPGDVRIFDVTYSVEVDKV